MDSQIQRWRIFSDMPEDEIERLIRGCGISADEQEVGIGLGIRKFDQSAGSAHKPESRAAVRNFDFSDELWASSDDTSGDSSPDKDIGPLFAEGGPPAAPRKFDELWASPDVPEAGIGPLSHEFGESGDFSQDEDIGPLFADWGPPASARKFNDELWASSDVPESDISGGSSQDKDIGPLFAEWGPPASARKFDDELWASSDVPEGDIGSLSHEFSESGDSVTQTEVTIGQGECVETTDKPELDTRLVIPWTTNWQVRADELKVIPRGTKWWPVPADKPEVDEETVMSENVGATKNMIPEPVIYEIHNSGTYWTQVDGVIAAPPTQLPTTSVIKSVFYFQMDSPLPPSTKIRHLGSEWGYRPMKHDCGTCFDELSDHMTSSCPFMVLATQFNERKSRGMSPAKKTSSLKPLGGKEKGTEKSSRFEAYFPPVLSPAERTAANLMTRRKMNLIRICNYLDFTKVGEIKKLSRKFGRLIHAYIPIPGGNGFVNFVRRVDALRAIKKMNDYEFEGLKLRVVWAYFDASRVDV